MNEREYKNKARKVKKAHSLPQVIQEHIETAYELYCQGEICVEEYLDILQAVCYDENESEVK